MAGRARSSSSSTSSERATARSAPRTAERTENIVRWTEFDRGGHFAALEEPDLLIDDVRAFFGELREKG